MARRPIESGSHGGFDTHRRDSRFDVIVAIALGLVAVVIAGSVYLNEHQEHKATVDFHEATHRLLDATAAGIRTPKGRALEATSEQKVSSAEDHQDRAAKYTLAEVILATSLFLFGIAGISSHPGIKVGAFGIAAGVFVAAAIVLATV